MNKLIRIILPILLVINFFAISAKADIFENDSCIPYTSLDATKLLLTAVSGVTTGGAGVFGLGPAIGGMVAGSIIANNFSMLDTNAEGQMVTLTPANSLVTYYGASNVPFGQQIQRCRTQSSDNKVRFCYDPLGGINLPINGALNCDSGNIHAIGDGEMQWISGVFFKGKLDGDKLCVQTFLPYQYYNIGCKYTRDPSTSPNYRPDGVAQSCFDFGNTPTRSPFPLSGLVVQCFRETLYQLFVDCSQFGGTCGTGAASIGNMLPNFKNNMQRIIMAMLTLYIIFFGMKVALALEAPRKGEIFLLLFKVGFVVAFAIGDGVQEFLFPAALSLAEMLSYTLYAAASNNGLCYFDPASYPSGYGYLAVWDGLDCRIAHYFGVTDITNLWGLPRTLMMFFFSLPGFRFAFILIIIYTLLFLSIVAFVVHTFVLTLFVITLLAFLAPLFVPFVLFKQTKPFFDGWFKMVVAYSVQPVVLFAFVALMTVTADQLIYKNCKFVERQMPYTGLFGNGLKSIFLVRANDPDVASCKKSIGYILNPFDDATPAGSNATQQFAAQFGKQVSGVFTQYTELIDPGNLVEITKNLLILTFFMFVFKTMSSQIANLMTDLSGAPSAANMAIAPTKVFDSTIGAVKKAAIMILDAKTGGAASKVSQQVERVGNEVKKEMDPNEKKGADDKKSGDDFKPGGKDDALQVQQPKADPTQNSSIANSSNKSSSSSSNSSSSSSDTSGTPPTSST